MLRNRRFDLPEPRQESFLLRVPHCLPAFRLGYAIQMMILIIYMIVKSSVRAGALGRLAPASAVTVCSARREGPRADRGARGADPALG